MQNSPSHTEQHSHHQGSQGLLSPFLQKQRLAAARPHIRGTVLDIGCGDGALAEFSTSHEYVGVDQDPATLLIAKSKRPEFEFCAELSDETRRFDTVVALAVIEHIANPAEVLKKWASYLNEGGHLILTTPKPSLEWAHELGAKVGLFSHDAAEEHETLIDRSAMEDMLVGTGLEISEYRTFLAGANQLFVIKAS